MASPAAMGASAGGRTAAFWIEALQLLPHREGGYYREITRGGYNVTNAASNVRSCFTTIYFLLTPGSPSHLHRLCADEAWFFHAGDPLQVHCIYKTRASVNVGAEAGHLAQLAVTQPPDAATLEDGETPYAQYRCVHVGDAVQDGQVLQYTVPSHTIFGSSVAPHGVHGYSLVSCVVSPGFDYRDFELFTQEQLMMLCPAHESIIRELAYESIA